MSSNSFSRVIPGTFFLTFLWLLSVAWPAHADGSAPSAPQPGGELVASLFSAPSTLNPAIQSGLVTAFPGAQIFAGLVRFDDDWQPHPYLAEKWEISEDGLSVTVHLVKNGVFHDGVPITSEDVAFSISVVKTYHPFTSMMGPIQRVDTPDAHTAIIRLSHPHPAILLAMSPPLLPILPKHIYGSVEKVKNHPANLHPVGSGPFKVEEIIPGKEIRLVKNNEFFTKGRPLLDRLTIKIAQNTLEEVLGMETREIQLMVSFQDLNELEQLKGLPHLEVITDSFKGIGPIIWLAFNLQTSPLSDLRVRQALAYTIDRQFIVDSMTDRETNIETGPISSTSPLYTNDVNLYQQDFAKANRLLDEAGYPRDENGRRFALRLTFIPDKAGTNIRIVEFLRQLFVRNLGVDISIDQPQSMQEWMTRVANWDFDLTLDDVFNWGDPVIGVHRTYLCSNIRKGVIWSNTQNYCNPEVDALLAKAGVEMDFPERKALYATFQRIIVDDLPVFPLFRPFFAIARDRNLRGFEPNIWGLMSPLDTVFWDNTAGK